MSRTDDLRDKGARSVTGGGADSPFVRWPDSYAWVEGRVLSFWSGKYGKVMTLRLTSASKNLRAGDADDPEPVSSDQVINVGLSSTALQDVPEEVSTGAVVHVAFEGWETSEKSGNDYRVFEVLELEPAGDDGDQAGLTREDKQVEGRGGSASAAPGVGPGAPDAEPPLPKDDLPF